MLEVAISNEQQIPITATPRTANGNPARIDGALRITKQDGAAEVRQDPANPLSFTLVSGDEPGESNFLVEADADLGEGVTLISDTVRLTVTSASAQSFGLSAGAPEPKTPAPTV